MSQMTKVSAQVVYTVYEDGTWSLDVNKDTPLAKIEVLLGSRPRVTAMLRQLAEEMLENPQISEWLRIPCDGSEANPPP